MDQTSYNGKDDYKGWKHIIPCRTKSKNSKTLPLVSAGPLSYITIHWMTELMFRAYRRGITVDDLYDTPWKDSSEYNCILFEKLWKEEVKRKGLKRASVLFTVIRMVRRRMIVAALFGALLSAALFLRSSYILQKLLTTIETSDTTSYGYQALLFSLIILCSVMKTLCYSALCTTASVAGIRARSGVLSFLFQKILRHHHHSVSTGEIINVCVNDGQRIYDAILLTPLLFMTAPILFMVVYSTYLIGYWGLLGFVVVFGSILIKMSLAKSIFLLKCALVPITIERVKLMGEIFSSIKLIKMYAWEEPLIKKVYELRLRESRFLKYFLMAQNLMLSLSQLIPMFSLALTFLVMTFCKANIPLLQGFIYMSLLNALRMALGYIPVCLSILSESVNACHRLKELLVVEEEKLQKSPSNKETLISIENASFGWRQDLNNIISEKDENKHTTRYGATYKGHNEKRTENNGELSEDRLLFAAEESDDEGDVVPTLHDITMSLCQGQLVGVCGAVGSGKSSLIQAILGMMVKESGRLSVDQSQEIAYVTQQAWIMNTSVRENILFGKPFNLERYVQVIEACSLSMDLKQLPAGDQTEIGERGINLSGGQKQRISLARAVYSDTELVLLDDPLSAVDAHVGQHIFTHCITGLLKSKTVLFVTHQLQFLNKCDYILMIKDGRIFQEGTHEELMEDKTGEYYSLITSISGSPEKECEIDVVPTPEEFQCNKDFDAKKSLEKSLNFQVCESEKSNLKGKLTKEETISQDKSRLFVIWDYVEAAGGCGSLLIVIFCILLYSSGIAFGSFWVSHWLEAGSGGTYFNETFTVNSSEVTILTESPRIIDNPGIGFYQLVYGGALLFMLVVAALNLLTFTTFYLKSTFIQYEKMFSRVLYSPLSFFDVTPSGQVMNRFSKDIDEVETFLHFFLDSMCKFSAQIIGSVVLTSLAVPYFPISILPAVVILVMIVKFCQCGLQQTKRIENVTKSPVLSHITASIHGLSTIKAYKKEQDFFDKFSSVQDRNNMALLLTQGAKGWTYACAEVISVWILLSFFLLLKLVPGPFATFALTSLALISTLSISDAFLFALRCGLETSTQFISAERIQSYIDNLKAEAPAIVEHHRPEKDWPTRGAIRFINVDVRYREGLPLVLKNISLDIKPQEKIGIVGRTGSGKSSLALSLFRIMELDGGHIYIDNIDISTIGLKDLRSKLSIIPQDPVLFAGTIRYSLDPFNSHDDLDLWNALEKCHIMQAVLALDGQLEALVLENGENLSVGERQLLCMARALLRNNKVLVLDEATAAIDTETDSLIQETIKEVFADCTMLTIAHRLNTVINYDRILVLDKGEIIEFDTPEILLANQDSAFAQMINTQDI